MGGVDIGCRRAANVVGPDWYQSGPGLVIDFCTSPVRTGNSTYHVNQFKNRLDKHWKLHDIVFNYHTDFAETGGLA